MANETRGLLYETIADAALRQAVKLSGVVGNVYWNEKPKDVSVTPDFTIGNGVDEPSHVVLVTASGSSKESEKKSWRNLGEMQEVKAQLTGSPNVINIYFLSNVKAGVAAAAEHLYDAVIHVEKKSYYKSLESWVNDNLRNAAKTKDLRCELLQSGIKASVSLASSITSFAKDLAKVLKHRKTDLDPLWKRMQADYAKPSAHPTARTTSVRRGLGKLSVLEPQVRQVIYDNYKKLSGIPAPPLPRYVFDLGFLNKTIAGARFDDTAAPAGTDIKNTIDLLGAQTCEELLRRTPSAMQPWIDELQQLQNVPLYLDFIHFEFDAIINPTKLFTLLFECQRDPQSFATNHKIPFRGRLSRNWLFLTLLDVIKASTGRLTGFGYAQLASDVGKSKDLSSGYITIADWANCVPNVILPETVLRGVSDVLSSKVREIGRSELPKLSRSLIEVSKKSILEDRLISYRNFEALLWLLETELKKQGKAYTGKTPYGGWLNEYAQVGRASATTPFVRVGGTLIHWKSSHGTHVNDKTKELSARARNVKYQYDLNTKTFSRRAGVQRLALIIDGDWTDRNLKTLAESGWDIIVYPDQIKDLVSKL